MDCKHKNFEIDGQATVKGPHGVPRVVRSYRCKDCGWVWSDMSAEGKKEKVEMPKSKKEAAPEVKETKTKEAKPKAAKPKAEKQELKARTVSALADPRFAPGKKYERTVASRKLGKSVRCLLDCRRDGFYNAKGKRFDTPTDLTTTFAIEELGQSEKVRRPAANFFGLPILVHKNTRPDCKSNGKAKPKKAAKAAKAPKAKAPKAKPAKAAKPKAAKAKAAKPKAAKAKAHKPAPAAPAETPPETKPASASNLEPLELE